MTDQEQDSNRLPRAWAIGGLEPATFEALASGLPASELWSVLLEVLARRAVRQPSALLQQWLRDPFIRPSAVDQRTFVELDRHLLAAAGQFEAVELSPLAPLGACSSLAPGSQNRIVSALRGTEVVADPTNVLVLECARRLRADASQIVRLATSHRCVRAQEVPKGPGFAQHFRIFCLVTAGAEQKDHGFIISAPVEQIETYLHALDRLEENGYAFGHRSVTVLATPERAAIADRIAAAVEGVPVSRATLEHRYYHGLRFQINVTATEGQKIPFIDGGAFDWLGQLTSNRKLVFVASGMGSQLAAHLFRRVT